MEQDSAKMDARTTEKPKSGPIFSDRLVQFFQEEKFTDCTFKIDRRDLKAHKLILAGVSPVFEGMFFGQIASDTVFLDDVNFEDFRQTLSYIYGKTIDIYSVQNAWNLFYIAQKYLLEDLSKICYDYISKNKAMSNLILSYEFAELYDQVELKNDCLFDMNCAINAVFFTGYHMKPSTLAALLKLRFGYIIKLDLTVRIIEWAVKELEIQGIESTDPDNILQLLKSTDILRFLYKSWIVKNKCTYCCETLKNCFCHSKNGVVRAVASRLAENELVWEEHPNMDYQLWCFPPGTHIRAVYKIARRIDLSKSEEFVSYVHVDKECVVSALLVCTETKPKDCSTDEYEGSINVRFCLDDSNENVVKPTKITSRFLYNADAYVPLRYPVTMYPGQYYDVKISYENHSSRRKSILVCSYMSGEVEDRLRSNNARMYFYDDGNVIKGVGYYPL